VNLPSRRRAAVRLDQTSALQAGIEFRR